MVKTRSNCCLDEDQQGVEQDGGHAEFGRAEAGVGQLEFRFQVRVHTDVEGQLQVNHQHGQGRVEVQERGQADTDEHESLVDAVHRVVEVVAVDGPLGLPHAGKRPV